MSKTKKFASLFLAMLMTLSCMAMTASAYGEEEHVHDEACCQEESVARIPAMECPKCITVKMVYDTHTGVFTCPACGTKV